MRIIQKIVCSIVFAALFLQTGCATKKGQDDPILARIGDRTITVREFLYRSEFAARPPSVIPEGYARNRALLDNLIAEKIFAIEASDTCRLAKNAMFQAYIRGIQEQAMREELFFKAAYRKVKIDTTEIKSLYRFAGREYHVAFYTLLQDDLARKIQAGILADPQNAGAVFDALGKGRKPPVQTVAWKDPGDEIIHDALFTHPIRQDTVIGPLRLGKNLHIVMKVLDWKDAVVLDGIDVVKRWNDVVERVKKRKSVALWNQLIKKRMGGKTITFNPPVFKKLADLSFRLYTATGDSQRQDIIGNFLGNSKDVSPMDMFGNEEAFLKSPFFVYDGKTWTVEDFKKELAIHPLVYRTKHFTQQTFPGEFKKAVGDMVRDHYLTREAYKNKLQTRDAVKRNTMLWKDALIGMWERDEVLGRLARKHHLEGQTDKLTKAYCAYVDSLMKAYAGRVTVNTHELQKIALTGTDMVAYKPGVPYPLAVPRFQLFVFKQERY